MTVIATMPFIRYHRLVANYLMGQKQTEPPIDERWPHAAEFVEPQMDLRRGYITAKECSEREALLFDKLYADTEARKNAFKKEGPRYEREGS